MSVERFLDIDKALDTVENTEKAVLLVVDNSKGIDVALKPLEAISDHPEIKERGIKCFLICITDMPAILEEISDFEVSPTYYMMESGEETDSFKGLPKTEKELEDAVIKAFSN